MKSVPPVRPVRPQCQCAERAAAIKRAAAALLRGDLESAAAENDFVNRTLAEDAKAMADYMKQAAAYYVPPRSLLRRK